MLNVIDTATSQANLDFGIPYSEGFRDVYVKMGGDNVDTYVAPWYTRQVDRARARGYGHVGHYWVPDGNLNDPDLVDTPTQQADYMVDRLHDWRQATDFLVLDNEALDGAWMLTDAGAAEFIERFKARKQIPGRQCVMYGGWYDLAAHAWPLVLATGAMFLVADYRSSSQPPMNFPDLPTVPRSRIIGHQYGGKAFGGVVTDVNAFIDDAFDFGGAMYNPWAGYRVTGTWEDHASYSEGGTDWPLSYGTALRAPASGRLVNNGWVGTAGRRATLYFDQPVKRVRARSTTRMAGGYVEHDCDMTAFVFQHAKGYLGDAHYGQGALIGYSGASAAGQDYGGDVHLHGHGLCAHGARVDFMKFAGATTAGTGYEEIDMRLDAEDQAWIVNKLNATIQEGINQILGYGSGASNPASVGAQTRSLKADLNTLHVASPYSLKALSEQLASIGAAPGGGLDEAELAAELAPLVAPMVVNAITSGGVATSAELAALRSDVLAAVAQVDEETLLTFGLKRV